MKKEKEHVSYSREDKVIIEFGLSQLKILLMGLVVLICIAIQFGVLRDSIIFIIALTVLRVYAGGYHAESQRKCAIVSFGIMLVNCVLLRSDAWHWSVWSLVISSSVLIWTFAPVDNVNKRLDYLEMRVYAKKTKMVLVFELATVIVTLMINEQFIAKAIGLAIITECCLVGVEKLKECYIRIRYNK